MRRCGQAIMIAWRALHGSGGSAPRGQSLLRFAARFFPPRPPGYVLSRAFRPPP
jgi:hypothetical protein